MTHLKTTIIALLLLVLFMGKCDVQKYTGTSRPEEHRIRFNAWVEWMNEE